MVGEVIKLCTFHYTSNKPYVFQILRTMPNQLLGVLLMVSILARLLTVPFLENVIKFRNPFRRPVATTIFLIGTTIALWLGIGATLPIDKSLTLGVFQIDSPMT